MKHIWLLALGLSLGMAESFTLESKDLAAKSDSALVGYMTNAHSIQKASMISYYGRK